MGDGDVRGDARLASTDKDVAPQRNPAGSPGLRDDGPDLIGVGLTVDDLPTAMQTPWSSGPQVNPFPLRPARLRPRGRESTLVPPAQSLLWRQRRPGCRSDRAAQAGWPAFAARISHAKPAGVRRLLGALVAVTALLALPVAAQATLIFVSNPFNPAVFVANDNGGGAIKVGRAATRSLAGRRRRRLPARRPAAASGN